MNKFPLNKDNQTNDNETKIPHKEQIESQFVILPNQNQPQIDTRIVGLYGEIEENICKEVIGSFYYLKEMGKVNSLDKNKKDVISYTPIKFIISTNGGSVIDTFAVYDAMRDVMLDCEIHTFGIGKIMSAGVLLLAAGTKGKRKIGKNCRLMMHQITSGTCGHLDDHENNYKETQWLQERYVDELCKLTKMTKRKISNILKKKLDFYFDAEDAVKLGIADIII